MSNPLTEHINTYSSLKRGVYLRAKRQHFKWIKRHFGLEEQTDVSKLIFYINYKNSYHKITRYDDEMATYNHSFDVRMRILHHQRKRGTRINMLQLKDVFKLLTAKEAATIKVLYGS